MLGSRVKLTVWSFLVLGFAFGLLAGFATADKTGGDHWACFNMPNQCCVRFSDMPSGGNLYVCWYGYEGRNCGNCGWTQQ
jgi:hypothetical protein